MILKSYFKKSTRILALTLSMFLLLFVLMSVLTLLMSHYPDSALNIHQFFTNNYVYFTAFRWLLIAAIILLWPRFIRYYANKKSLSKKYTTVLLNARFKIGLWIILAELVLATPIVSSAFKAILRWFS